MSEAPSHPDCEACKQRAASAFRPSPLCGVRCDCTSDYCEEYKRHVMARFEIVKVGEKDYLVPRA